MLTTYLAAGAKKGAASADWGFVHAGMCTLPADTPAK